MEILNKSQVDIINRIVKDMEIIIEAVSNIANDCCNKVDKFPKGEDKEYGYNVISSLNGTVFLVNNAIENLKAAAGKTK
ncbi:MAG: hypothetical protein ACI4HO_09230 [Ruminococcus sp.]